MPKRKVDTTTQMHPLNGHMSKVKEALQSAREQYTHKEFIAFCELVIDAAKFRIENFKAEKAKVIA